MCRDFVWVALWYVYVQKCASLIIVSYIIIVHISAT